MESNKQRKRGREVVFKETCNHEENLKLRSRAGKEGFTKKKGGNQGGERRGPRWVKQSGGNYGG